MIARTIVLAAILVLLGTSAYADECNSARYVDNGDATVTDCRTGLIWLKDANCKDTINGIENAEGYLSWYDALKWVAGLKYGLCGLTADSPIAGDWRLPTKTEWMAMFQSARKQGFTVPTLTNGAGTAKWTEGDIFDNVQSNDYYWSSTTNPIDSLEAFEANMFDGTVDNFYKDFGNLVWPVRGGQSGEFGNVIIQ